MRKRIVQLVSTTSLSYDYPGSHFSLLTAARPRTLSVPDFPTFSVQGPRGHHQAALQPFSGGHRWGSVCLASAAATGIGEGRRSIADFSEFYSISLLNLVNIVQN